MRSINWTERGRNYSPTNRRKVPEIPRIWGLLRLLALLVIDGEYSPFVGNALQHMRSTVGERDTRAGH